MLFLRCTQKLLKKNPGPTNALLDTLMPTLGSWHANLIYLAHSPIVLCVNDVSLLAVLVPGRNFSNFGSAFRDRLAERLGRMGLSPNTISVERLAMEIVQIQPSNSRSILASMNDFVRHLKFQVRNRLTFVDLNALEDRLSETPMGALEYRYPVEVAAAAFNLDQEGLLGDAS
jgi:uncharacterized protein DUF6933